ncbi:J domain-containing protein [Aphelenchoides fujianensis]|nr:J domain-containing protein [Aphelenchoides fujianensis]
MLRVHSRLKLRPPSSARFASTSRTAPGDLYSTLGVKRDATAKEVKSAFYELSKKYHPDRNPEDAEKAAAKFQTIVDAYEVLGHAEKRRAYDREHPAHRPAGVHSAAFRQRGTDPHVRQKQYTDLDIDFRDLEHFQRTSRKRRAMYEQHHELNEELFKQSQNYHSNSAVEREREERRIREEIERQKAEARFRTPTFEQLLRQEEQRKREAGRKQMIRGIGFAAMLTIFLLLLGGTRRL